MEEAPQAEAQAEVLDRVAESGPVAERDRSMEAAERPDLAGERDLSEEDYPAVAVLPAEEFPSRVASC